MTEIKYSKSLPEDFDLKKVYGVIYKITNNLNHKVYIGQSINVKKRFICYNHNKGKGQIYLHNTFLKYGISNFDFEVIDFVMDKESLDKLEIFYIEKFKSTDRNFGYNIENGGYGVGKCSDETKIKIGNSNRGRKRSEESKEKNKLAHLGKKPSVETRKNMSKNNKGENNGFYGKKHSEETRAKMRNAKLGKKWHLVKPRNNISKNLSKYFEFFYYLILHT